MTRQARVLESVNGVAGLEGIAVPGRRRPRRAVGRAPVALPAARSRGGRWRGLRWGRRARLVDRCGGALVAEVGQADPSRRRLAEIDEPHARFDFAHRPRAKIDNTHGEAPATSRSGGDRLRRPHGGGKALPRAEVHGLPVHEVGADARRATTSPALVATHRRCGFGRCARCAARRGRRAPCPSLLGIRNAPTWPRYPAIGQFHFEAVRAEPQALGAHRMLARKGCGRTRSTPAKVPPSATRSPSTAAVVEAECRRIEPSRAHGLGEGEIRGSR